MYANVEIYHIVKYLIKFNADTVKSNCIFKTIIFYSCKKIEILKIYYFESLIYC